MRIQDLALAVHLVGVILWIGGSVAAATVGAFAGEQNGNETALKGARRALLWWATPGLLLAWVGGLTMLLPNFTTLYARAGWMHGKLTLLLVATGITGVLTGRLRKAAKGDKPAAPKLLNGLSFGLAALALLIVGLAVLKPGA
jgi:protoporphyrinogen IX oxidase